MNINWKDIRMDAIVSGDMQGLTRQTDENFLVREGLEVLASYRAIGDANVRQAVRALIASLAASTDITQ